MKYRNLILIAGFLSTASHTVLAAGNLGLPAVFRESSTNSVPVSTGAAPMDPTQHPIGLSCPFPFLCSSASNVVEHSIPAVFSASGTTGLGSSVASSFGSSGSLLENTTTASGSKRRAGYDDTSAPESLVSSTSTTASAVSCRPRADSELDLDELALALQDLGLDGPEKNPRK